MVPRLWCPSVLCPECKYPNDRGFSFCQRCGLTRLPPTRPSPSTSVQFLPSIDNRLASIRSQRNSLSYARQKSSLQKQLEDFLSSLPSPKNLQSATPIDIVFLFGRTKKAKPRFTLLNAPCSGHILKANVSVPPVWQPGLSTVRLEN